MLLFKDILSSDDVYDMDELFSDSKKVEEVVEGAMYRIALENRKVSDHVDDSLIGGNASAEGQDADECAQDTTRTVIDAVEDCRLQKVVYFETCGDVKSQKAAFTKEYFKPFCKALEDKLKKRGKTDDELKEFKNNVVKSLKFIKDNWKNLDFYTGDSAGESPASDALRGHSLCYLQYSDATGMPEFMYFLKDSVVEQKA